MTTARRRLPTLPLIRAPHLHLGYADSNRLGDWYHLEHHYESAHMFPHQFWLPATQSKLPRSKIDSFAKLLMITSTSQDHTGSGYSQRVQDRDHYRLSQFPHV